MFNKIILYVILISILLCSCSTTLHQYVITLTTGERIVLDVSDYSCRAYDKVVKCSADDFLSTATVYYNVEKFEIVEK